MEALGGSEARGRSHSTWHVGGASWSRLYNEGQRSRKGETEQGCSDRRWQPEDSKRVSDSSGSWKCREAGSPQEPLISPTQAWNTNPRGSRSPRGFSTHLGANSLFCDLKSQTLSLQQEPRERRGLPSFIPKPASARPPSLLPGHPGLLSSLPGTRGEHPEGPSWELLPRATGMTGAVTACFPDREGLRDGL